MPTTHEIHTVIKPLEITPFPGSDTIWLGDDTRQLNGSFKIRGANHALHEALLRNPGCLRNGVYCPSAGNAGQGAALAASRLGVASHIFMPATAPLGKIEAVEGFGGTVTLVPGTVDDALDEAREACEAKNGFFLHPFDDVDVIDGQSSLGHEILASEHDFDAVFVPVGGGSLLAGVCKAFCEKDATAKVFGVQLEGCDAFSQSVRAGYPIELSSVNTLADGIAVKRAGALTLRIALESENFGGMITVTENQLGCALSELDMLTAVVAETAAGLSFAGLRKHIANANHVDQKCLAIITGKHRDPARFQQLVST